MNDIPASLFLGPLFMIAFFIACTVTVAGIKILYLYFKRAPIRIKPEKPKTAKRKISAETREQRKPVRSIEINPDEVDKIYVKKVS